MHENCGEVQHRSTDATDITPEPITRRQDVSDKLEVIKEHLAGHVTLITTYIEE